MIVTIHQPDFLPWLGFFDRWQKSDLFIVLDDVQFLRRGWHHRDKIKAPNGVQWLTVPVVKKGRYYQRIREVEINNQEDWRRKHLNIIRVAYSKAPNFDYTFAGIEKICERKHNLLIDFNMELLKFSAAVLGINTPAVFASTFRTKETGSRRLLELVKAVGGDVYLTGTGSRDYLNERIFSDACIELRWQKFDHPIYPQLYGGFKKMLSVLDFLMMTSDEHVKRFKSK